MVVVFTEGGQGKGYGHLTRCSALARVLLDQGLEVSVFVNGPESLAPFFDGIPFQTLSWADNLIAARAKVGEAKVCILDSYEMSEEFVHDFCLAGDFLPVFFDDNARIDYPGGIIINGAPDALLQYRKPQRPGTQFLIGVDYQVMRREFWNCSPRAISSQVQRVLLTLGGDDIRNLMPSIYRLIKASFPGVRVVCITTSHSRSRAELEAAVSFPDHLILDATAVQLVEVMSCCDLAVSAGGQTSFELARCGLPSVFVQVIENQMATLQSWARLGWGGGTVSWNSKCFDSDLTAALARLAGYAERQAQARLGQSIVDGQGAFRVAKFIRERVSDQH